MHNACMNSTTGTEMSREQMIKLIMETNHVVYDDEPITDLNTFTDEELKEVVVSLGLSELVL